MNRQPSRGEPRRTAARSFAMRRRRVFEAFILRRPDPGETPLSANEIEHGIARGLLADAPARATLSFPYARAA